VTSTKLVALAALLAAHLILAHAAAAQVRPSLPPGSPFAGGVPEGVATPDVLSLTVVEVIHRALDHNLGALLAEQTVEGDAGARAVALSELLPHVSGSVSESRRKNNLEAFGFPLRGEFPRLVGPFNVFDARITLSQKLLDLSALHELKASEHSLSAARLSSRSARDLVVLVAANLYLQTLATGARAESARAQRETAEALHRQAMNLRENGLVPGIDVLRAEVRLSMERQRATAAANDYEKAKLQLARVIGLPLGQPFALSQDVPFVPVPGLTLEDALARAYRERPDYLAALERVRAAEATRKAVVGEMLPSIRLNADYGAIGLQVPSALATFNVTGTVDVPIFEGGRIRGKLAEADAELKKRRAEADDARAEVDYDVRSAFLDLTSTEEELQTATRGRELADQQLQQARDRFAAGVASNIEVVQAQEAVAAASEQYISALYGYNVAKAMLARSLGTAEDAVAKYLGGAVAR